MSIAESPVPTKPGTEVGRPHTLHLAVQFLDKTTGRRVDITMPLPRQATRKADIEAVTKHLAGAVDQVLNNADETSDAVVTLALLRQPADPERCQYLAPSRNRCVLRVGHTGPCSAAPDHPRRTHCGRCGRLLGTVEGQAVCVNAGCSNYVEALS